MNYWSLTFEDDNYEKQYVNEQFLIERQVFKRVTILAGLVGIAATITNFIFQNHILAAIFLVTTIMMGLTHKLTINKVGQLDIIALLIQLLLHSANPVLVLLGEMSGSRESLIDPFDQYTRGLVISYFSYTSLIGSKYYLKAFPFIYSALSQFIIIGIQGIPFTMPFKIYFILAVLAIVINIYYHELGKRRYFIMTQQQNLCNLNVLSNFRSPYFQCYLNEFTLKLINANPKAQRKFNIIDQQQFLKFCRGTILDSEHISNHTMDLEKFIYKLIGKSGEAYDFTPRKNVMVLLGTYSKSNFKYYISKYVDEDKKQIVMVNIQRVIDHKPQPMEKVHNFVMKRLLQTIVKNLQPLYYTEQQESTKKLQMHRLFMDFYNSYIYTHPKIHDTIAYINLQTTLFKVFSIYKPLLQQKGLSVRSNIMNSIQIVRQKLKLTELLIGNLVHYCIQASKQQGLIYIQVDRLRENELEFIIKYQSKYTSAKRNPFELQISGFIVSQIGPLSHIRHQIMNNQEIISFSIYQSQIEEQLGIIRKSSECNFVKLVELDSQQISQME